MFCFKVQCFELGNNCFNVYEFGKVEKNYLSYYVFKTQE